MRGIATVTLCWLCVTLGGTKATSANDDVTLSTGTMLQNCQTYVSPPDATNITSAIEAAHKAKEFGSCEAGFSGILQILAIAPIENTCVPRAMNLEKLIRIFTLYARSNPGRAKDPFAFVTLSALSSYYPCK